MAKKKKLTADLVAEIEKHKEAIAKHTSELETILSDVCPFAPGDITTCLGYAHYGKKMRVDQVFMRQVIFIVFWAESSIRQDVKKLEKKIDAITPKQAEKTETTERREP